MMFPERLSVGDSEESDANLHAENTHNKAINFFHGLGIIRGIHIFKLFSPFFYS